MSQDVFSKCVALKLAKPIDRDELYDILYDYLDDIYGSYVYSVHFGGDFIALYHDQESEDQYGITRIDISRDFFDLRDILVTLCEKHEIEIDRPYGIDGLDPKYFTDFWYNGVDCTASGMNWEDL